LVLLLSDFIMKPTLNQTSRPLSQKTTANPGEAQVSASSASSRTSHTKYAGKVLCSILPFKSLLEVSVIELAQANAHLKSVAYNGTTFERIAAQETVSLAQQAVEDAPSRQSEVKQARKRRKRAAKKARAILVSVEPQESVYIYKITNRSRPRSS
jgi:hypothetical protein